MMKWSNQLMRLWTLVPFFIPAKHSGWQVVHVVLDGGPYMLESGHIVGGIDMMQLHRFLLLRATYKVYACIQPIKIPKMLWMMGLLP